MKKNFRLFLLGIRIEIINNYRVNKLTNKILRKKGFWEIKTNNISRGDKRKESDSIVLEKIVKIPKLSYLNISGFTTPEVTNMWGMFRDTGKDVDNFQLVGNLSNWNTGKVNDMSYMFYYMGANTSGWSLDLSGWDISNVTSYSKFNNGVTDMNDTISSIR